jgi:molybdopterin/thiamine biosynthesis adenylyltransferase
MNLTSTERERYIRHLQLPQVGTRGQIALKNSRVLIIGLGGLGSPAALYLAAAGVGMIGLVDPDQVSLSNLQRQILYASNQVGQNKVDCAQTRLAQLNPEIQVETYPFQVTAQNIMELIASFDAIIDGTDQFASRYLINDACVLARKPYFYGAIQGFEGQLSVFHPPRFPCYRCLYPTAPPADALPNCNENGVLGVLPGIIGTLQATEVLKFLLKIGAQAAGKLIVFDALHANFFSYQIQRDPDCKVCGSNPEIRSVQDHPTDSGPAICISQADFARCASEQCPKKIMTEPRNQPHQKELNSASRRSPIGARQLTMIPANADQQTPQKQIWKMETPRVNDNG